MGYKKEKNHLSTMTSGFSRKLEQIRDNAKKRRPSNTTKGKNGPSSEAPPRAIRGRRRQILLSKVQGLKDYLPWKTNRESTDIRSRTRDEPAETLRQQQRVPLPGMITLAAGRRPSPSVLHAQHDDISELDLNIPRCGLAPSLEPADTPQQQQRLPLPGEITLAAGRRPSLSVLHAHYDDVSELDLNTPRRTSTEVSDDDATVRGLSLDDSEDDDSTPKASYQRKNLAPRNMVVSRDKYQEYPEWLIRSRSFFRGERWTRIREHDQNTNVIPLIPLGMQHPRGASRDPPERTMNVVTEPRSSKPSKANVFRRWRRSVSHLSNVFRHVTGRASKSSTETGGLSSVPASETSSTSTIKAPRRKESRNQEDYEPEPFSNYKLGKTRRRRTSTESDLTLHRTVAHGNSGSSSPDRVRHESLLGGQSEKVNDTDSTRTGARKGSGSARFKSGKKVMVSTNLPIQFSTVLHPPPQLQTVTTPPFPEPSLTNYQKSLAERGKAAWRRRGFSEQWEKAAQVARAIKNYMTSQGRTPS